MASRKSQVASRKWQVASGKLVWNSQSNSVMRAIRALGGFFSAIVVIAILILVPQAQGTISFSISGTWPAGPDYATDVLGDPWDFSNSEDIGLDPTETTGWSSFAVSGGLAGGVTDTGDTSLSLLYRGRYGIISPGKTGRRFPIDPARFQKLAFKMSDSAGGQNEFPQVYWFHYPWADPADPNGQLFGAKLLPGTVTGNQVYVTDLTTGAQGGSLPWVNGSLQVRGLRLDPNISRFGQTVFYDWVRLTPNDNASGAAMVTMSWGGSGSATVNIIDAGGTPLRIVNNVNTSSIVWNYGVLPPGTYTVQVTRGGTVSRPFTINTPPLVQVTDPDETGGADYATTVLGNAWDMSAVTDVINTVNDNYTPRPATFSGGVMTATNTNGDATVTLLAQDGTGATPIDSTRYRYLTYRFQVDGPYDLRDGSVARIVWGSQQFIQAPTATTTKDIIVWPGMNSYTFDLGALSTAADGGLETGGAAEAWTSGSKRHFRFDPHEFDPVQGSGGTRAFHIDDVKLAAMDETANDAFLIKWGGSDLDGGNPSIALYYDTDTNPSSKTLIQNGLLMSQGSFTWNTIAVPVGTYYIYVEANDGVQTYGRYSTGTVRVVRSAASSNPAMALEAPASGITILQPFTASGWAIDRGAASGTGVDQVRMSATSSSGTVTTLGDATLFVRRDDIGTEYGAQFTNSGFTFTVSGLLPGTYTLTASARSTATGTFNQSTSITITLPAANPQMAINSPVSPSTMGTPFTLAGWSVDLGDPTTTGVIRVNIYSYPIDSGGVVIGPPTFLGQATHGLSRPDIGAAYGARFTNSGFSLVISSLAAGRYRIFAYSESKVTLSTNSERSVDVTVGTPVSNPLMSIDGPANNSTVQQPFLTGGWAADRGAGTGPGVDAVHVWAFPVVNGVVDTAHGMFVAQGQTGGARQDVGAVFGSPQFDTCGFTFPVQGLSPGVYELGVYARSTVTGTFNNVKFVRITVTGPQAPVSNPQMSLDGPTAGQQVSQPFVTGGWAIDLGATSGTGVDAIHVWAFPVVNSVVGEGRFVDQATLNGGRPDVAAAYGSQFQNSGFNFLMTGLTPGEYIIGVYVHSGVSGQFNADNPGQTKFVRITVVQ